MDNLKNNFGKRKVSPLLKTSLVQEVFSSVAKNYDVMNDFMSFGTHRLWKRELIDFMNIQRQDTIVDVGSGTGDLIDLILKKKITNNIFSVDLNKEMLKYSKKKFRNNKIKFIQANAEKLPFSDNYFDKYIISFCLRNVTNIKKAIKESIRVLKPGGTFYCLEFSSPSSPIIDKIYKQYKSKIIPLIGDKIAKDKKAYEYLQESIDLFPDQEKLSVILEKCGFEEVSYFNMFNGIVSIHKSFKA